MAESRSYMEPSVAFEKFDNNVKFSDFEEIGHYSADDEEQYHGDQSQLRYLILPEKMDGLSWDLNEGFEDAPTEGLQDIRRLDHLLRWILENKSVKQQLQNPEQCTFICNWGVIRSLLQTATKVLTDWDILATRYKGAIYISRANSEPFLEYCSSERSERQFYWNRKIHQYVTSGKMYGKIDARGSASKSERYNAVVRRKFGGHQLLYSTAVDAVDPNRSSEEGQYVVIRMCKFNSNDYIGFAKLTKLLVECEKLALKELLCGFHAAGIVRKLKFLKTDEISRRLRKSFYSEERAFGYLNTFLTAVKRIVIKDDPTVVYKFCYDSRKKTKDDRNYMMYEEVKNCSPESLVLPEWYISEFEAISE